MRKEGESKISEKELKEQYDKLKELYKKLGDEVFGFLKKTVKKNKLKVHGIKTRLKTFESFYKHVVKENITTNHFEKIEDIAGVRIICYYRLDLDTLRKIIEDNYCVVKTILSREREEQPFGYSSDHYIIKLPERFEGHRYDDIKNLKCEIQVRTILMDAWASVSHHLDYKQETDIPKELKKDFNALSGLFYIADTIFELFKDSIDEYRARLNETIQQDKFNFDLDVNLDTLKVYSNFKLQERIPDITSEIVTELIDHGFKRIRQLDEKLNFVNPVIKPMEIEEFNLDEWEPKYSAVGTIRATLALIDDKYFRRPMPLDVRELIKKYRSQLKKRK